MTNEAETIDEMREVLQRDFYRTDPLIHRAFDHAMHTGLSNEEAYIFLAYHLAIKCKKLEDMYLDHLRRTPAPSNIA